MQSLFEEARRFISSGWKSEETAFAIQGRLRTARYTDSAERREAIYLANRVSSFVHTIRMQNKFLNPSILKPGMERLPVVGWAPEPVLNDETGVASVPSMPELPQGLSKAALARWKKDRADEEMGYKRVRKPRQTKKKEDNAEDSGALLLSEVSEPVVSGAEESEAAAGTVSE